jgi:hypothetical protein
MHIKILFIRLSDPAVSQTGLLCNNSNSNNSIFGKTSASTAWTETTTTSASYATSSTSVLTITPRKLRKNVLVPVLPFDYSRKHQTRNDICITSYQKHGNYCLYTRCLLSKETPKECLDRCPFRNFEKEVSHTHTHTQKHETCSSLWSPLKGLDARKRLQREQ